MINRKVTLIGNCKLMIICTFISLLSFSTSTFAQSKDAKKFFENYNNSELKMICPDGNKKIVVRVVNDMLEMAKIPLPDAVKHESKNQYYLDGTTMDFDFFFDFEDRYLITIMNGEEMSKIKCE